MPQSPARKRGAQPGNRNASKAAREPKAAAGLTPIPANINELLDLEILFLSELIADLRQQCRDQAQEMEPEEKRKMVRTITASSLATLQMLRAKQLAKSDSQEAMSYFLDSAIQELNAELEANLAANQAVRTAERPPSPYPPLPTL